MTDQQLRHEIWEFFAQDSQPARGIVATRCDECGLAGAEMTSAGLLCRDCYAAWLNDWREVGS